MPTSPSCTKAWFRFFLIALALSSRSAAVPTTTRSVPADVLRQTEELVARSIVRINRQTAYRIGQKLLYMSNYGTGVVVGEEEVNGHREYLILSNQHVAKNNHVSGQSTLYIATGCGVAAPIVLETLSVDERRDQALLRTVGCTANFTVPHYVIGRPREDAKLDTAFTEGYGNGKFNTLVGDIESTRSKNWGLRCYRIDVPVGAGQSGAPLVVIGADRRLYLPALIFCGTDSYTAATPLYPGKGVLHKLEMEERLQRP
jgi:hypothetical protein